VSIASAANRGIEKSLVECEIEPLKARYYFRGE
jgi:hypothetical protein